MINHTKLVVTFSLAWLILSNTVGLLLSTLLLFPQLNSIIAPFTYGRILPLHLNFALYGWCSIPLIGVLFKIYNPINSTDYKLAASSIIIWSLALLTGGYSWLEGESSGKIFLEWSGLYSKIFIFALTYLWLVLFIFFLKDKSKALTKNFFTKLSLLIFLSFIPIIFCLVLDPSLFPPINIETSGATGASLFVSSLVIIAIFIFTPFTFNIYKSQKNDLKILLVIIIFHLAFWSIIPHGNSSHHDFLQILGLSSLVIWIPIIIWHLSKFDWPISARRWIKSFECWTSILIFSAIIMFFPNILDSIKFSSFLVAHVHVAMAGMISSFCMIILIVLLNYEHSSKNLSDKNHFLIWHFGLVLHLSALITLGMIEKDYFGYGPINFKLIFTLAYLLRIAGGLFMTYASIVWFKRITGSSQ